MTALPAADAAGSSRTNFVNPLRPAKQPSLSRSTVMLHAESQEEPATVTM